MVVMEGMLHKAGPIPAMKGHLQGLLAEAWHTQVSRGRWCSQVHTLMALLMQGKGDSLGTD